MSLSSNIVKRENYFQRLCDRKSRFRQNLVSQGPKTLKKVLLSLNNAQKHLMESQSPQFNLQMEELAFNMLIRRPAFIMQIRGSVFSPYSRRYS